MPCCALLAAHPAGCNERPLLTHQPSVCDSCTTVVDRHQVDCLFCRWQNEQHSWIILNQPIYLNYKILSHRHCDSEAKCKLRFLITASAWFCNKMWLTCRRRWWKSRHSARQDCCLQGISFLPAKRGEMCNLQIRSVVKELCPGHPRACWKAWESLASDGNSVIKMWMIYDDLRFAIDQIPFRLVQFHSKSMEFASFCMILPYLHTSVTITGCGGSLSNGHGHGLRWAPKTWIWSLRRSRPCRTCDRCRAASVGHCWHCWQCWQRKCSEFDLDST